VATFHVHKHFNPSVVARPLRHGGVSRLHTWTSVPTSKDHLQMNFGDQRVKTIDLRRPRPPPTGQLKLLPNGLPATDGVSPTLNVLGELRRRRRAGSEGFPPGTTEVWIGLACLSLWSLLWLQHSGGPSEYDAIVIGFRIGGWSRTQWRVKGCRCLCWSAIIRAGGGRFSSARATL